MMGSGITVHPQTQYSCGERSFYERDNHDLADMTLPIDTEIACWLAQKAAAQGVNIEQVAIETLRRQARKPSINDVFADVAALSNHFVYNRTPLSVCRSVSAFAGTSKSK